MNAESVLPVVEIDTPDGEITLMNATVEDIVPVWHVTPTKDPGPKDGDDLELEQIELTFATITVEHSGGKGKRKWTSDNWQLGIDG